MTALFFPKIFDNRGQNMRSQYIKGMYHGLPICLGYLSVSFGFGLLAAKSGLGIAEAALISLTNMTSAGQAAGVGIIAASGSIIEMILTQLVINIRYSLMAISLTQKLDDSFTTSQRMLVSFGITDEIYAVAASYPSKLDTSYMKGLILTPLIGWVSGTVLGAAAGEILPRLVTDSLGILLYGMFIAIIIPPCKKCHPIILSILTAAAVSTLLFYFAPFISTGFAVIISAVISAVVAVVDVMPVPAFVGIAQDGLVVLQGAQVMAVGICGQPVKKREADGVGGGGLRLAGHVGILFHSLSSEQKNRLRLGKRLP